MLATLKSSLLLPIFTPSTAKELAVSFRDLEQHAETLLLSPLCSDRLLSILLALQLSTLR